MIDEFVPLSDIKRVKSMSVPFKNMKWKPNKTIAVRGSTLISWTPTKKSVPKYYYSLISSFNPFFFNTHTFVTVNKFE
jgi:hypothetical protein